MNPVRHRALAAELAFDEIIVIEFLFGQIQSVNVGFFGPASLFIRATFGAGPGIAGEISATVGAGFGRHGDL